MSPSVHTAEVLPARAVLFLGILAFHVLLAYLFATGLIQGVIHVLVPEPLEVIPIPEKTDPVPPTSPADPNFRPTTLIAQVPPVIDINPPVDPVVEPIATATLDEPPHRTIDVPPVEEVPLRFVGRNVMPNTEDYYPAPDRRAGNEGTTQVRSCVNENGRLDGTPTVESSSGRESLDKAAIRVARDGRYARAMRGDTAVPNCYRFRVTFTMH